MRYVTRANFQLEHDENWKTQRAQITFLIIEMESIGHECNYVHFFFDNLTLSSGDVFKNRNKGLRLQFIKKKETVKLPKND